VQPDRRAGALGAAAKRKSQAAHSRATNALRTLDAHGESITFQAVAQAAGVSRQWLYTQPELRGEIEELRAAEDRLGDRPGPARERASENSLRHRNRALLEENQRLRAENAALKDELASVLGELRANRHASERAA
jgi:FtsZ-binding cell division protein ZapB